MNANPSPDNHPAPEPPPLKTVGVTPATALSARPCLFAALAQAHPVRFAPWEALGRPPVDGVLILADDPDLAASIASAGIPALLMHAPDGEHAPSSRDIHFTDDELLDPVMRNRTLRETAPPSFSALPCQAQDRPLALDGNHPVWLHRPSATAGYDWAGWELEELAGGRCLRDESRGWRFMRLLPLHHFLRRLTADCAWQRPLLRAAFLIDDPNLHRLRYGYLDFARLASDARAHHFHAVIATVPLDQWYVNRRVASLLHASGDCLSLTPHGNNHLHHELSRPDGAASAPNELAQALDRIGRMEKKTGLQVGRVMSPPHGVCSRAMVDAMSRLGFDAVTCAQPIPWLEAAPADRPLTGWHCAQMHAGHFPVLHRRSIPHCLTDRAHRDELVMMAYLHQPVILCGHHPDLADPDGLPSIAAALNGLAPVQWCDLTRMVESNFETLRQGPVLRVRVFSRRICLPLPEGVESVGFESPMEPAEVAVFNLSVDGAPGPVAFGEPVAVGTDTLRSGGSLRMNLIWPDTLDPGALNAPRWSPRPYLRRALTEARDRLAPLIRKAPDFH